MSDPFARFRRFLRELKRRKVYLWPSRPPLWQSSTFSIVLLLAWAFKMTAGDLGS